MYLPCHDEACARDLGRWLVQRRLAACANVLPRMTSIYRWEGAIQEDKEALLLLKTLDENLPRLWEAIRERHPYRLPGAVAYAASGGFPEYLDWVREECGQARSG